VDRRDFDIACAEDPMRITDEIMERIGESAMNLMK
jgi:hypothetical protein